MNEHRRLPARWKRSRDCADGACAEVWDAGYEVLIRNSLRPETAVCFTLAEWRAFVGGVKRGDFG